MTKSKEKTNKKSDGFVRTVIPEELAFRIDKFIKESNGKFRKRAEVIRHAIVKFLEEEEQK